MNQFIVMGRLTKDPELKELENGKKVCNITIAVDENYKDKEGKKVTEFLHYSLWDKLAENICAISKKGALIKLEGRNKDKEVEIDGKKYHFINSSVEHYQHYNNVKDFVPEPIEETKTEEMVK